MKGKLILALILFLVGFHYSSVFAADTKVSGEIYGFYVNDLTQNGHGKGYNKFDLSRVYITLKSTLSKEVSVRVTADVANMAGDARDIYLKYAYLDWNIEKIIPHSTIRFGLQQTGWIDYMNKVWERRYVAKTLMDEYKALSSADYSISYIVKFPKGYGHGSVQVLQGPGYKGTEENRYKDISAFVFFRPLMQVPDLAASMVGGYYYKGFSDKPDITSDNKKDRLAALGSLAYGGIVRLSGEYFMSWDRTDPGDTEDLKKDGISVYGDIKFPTAKSTFLKKMALVGRYDLYDKDKDQKDNEREYLIAGVEWEIVEGFNLMPNFQREKMKNEDAQDTFVVNALFAF
jgi:hypothetical protein